MVTANLRQIKLKRGQIILTTPRYKQILIGGGKSPGMQAFHTALLIGKGGKIIFHGKTTISQGTVLRCEPNSTIEFGDSFYCNCNCYMRSASSIKFGEGCSLGWNITINTTDGHNVWHNGIMVEREGPAEIGSNVWITPHCTINKNVKIPNHCIVAQGAIVTKSFTDEHCIIGGIPAKIVTRNISWKN